jgi:hypothetical protein
MTTLHLVFTPFSAKAILGCISSSGLAPTMLVINGDLTDAGNLWETVDDIRQRGGVKDLVLQVGSRELIF